MKNILIKVKINHTLGHHAVKVEEFEEDQTPDLSDKTLYPTVENAWLISYHLHTVSITSTDQATDKAEDKKPTVTRKKKGE